MSLLQDCSQHPDAPALGTAVRHGARTLSQVGESHGTPLCQPPTTREGLAGGILCSPRPGKNAEGRGHGQAPAGTTAHAGSPCKCGWRNRPRWAGSRDPITPGATAGGAQSVLSSPWAEGSGSPPMQGNSQAEKGHGLTLNKEGAVAGHQGSSLTEPGPSCRNHRLYNSDSRGCAARKTPALK